MTTKLSFNSSFCLIVAPLLLAGCGEPADSPQDHQPLLVVVVGDGVPPIDSTTQRAFPLNRSQGQAMFDGVNAALAKSPRLRSITNLLEVKGYDDKGDPQAAATIAHQLQKNPRVLAVIGHATSETTQAAVRAYESVGIPLLMPIATSPKVMYPPGDGTNHRRRCKNAFRLPPADHMAQAPAIAYVLQRLGSKRIALIQDITYGARGYSTPLTEALNPFVAGRQVSHGDADRGHPTFLGLASSIRSNRPDTIIFCGYGSTAIEILAALRSAYASASAPDRPRIVLSDGCYMPDLDTSEFAVFLTFPHAKLRDPVTADDIKDTAILKETFGDLDNPSYELFGYDAMLILGEAIKGSQSSGVGRHSVMRLLARGQGFVGMAGTYKFEEGENTLSCYDVLSDWSQGNQGFAPRKRETIDPSTLAAIRDSAPH